MRFVMLAAVLASTAGAPIALPAWPALACSAGPDFNPVTSSEQIVGGTVLGWEPAPNPQDLPPTWTFQTVRITLHVEASFRGNAGPGTIEFYDTASVFRTGQGPSGWHGSSGACGAFNADPTGRYVLLGLYRAEDGTLRSHLLRTFFIGDRSELSGARYDRIRAQLDAYGLTLPTTPRFIGPPATGNAGLIATTPSEGPR
jgi:hypothetical protein